MILDIVSTIGENCITIEDGEKVFAIIHPELVQGHEVTLDFTEVKIFASPFFNIAIGQLLSDVQFRNLQSNLHIVGLSQHGYYVLNRVIENAQRYYSNTPRFRDSVQKVIVQQANDL